MEPGAEFPRCRKGGFWQEPSIWPLCVEPPKCDPSIGPSMPLSVNNSGLVGAYTELLYRLDAALSRPYIIRILRVMSNHDSSSISDP